MAGISNEPRRAPENRLSKPGRSNRSDLIETLANLRGLAGLPRRKLQILADRVVIRTFARDVVIHEAGQARHYMYILFSGIARLTCVNRKGNRVLLEVLGPGDVVAVPSLLPYVRSDLRFRAFTDCQIGLLTAKRLVQDIVGLPFGHFNHAHGLTCGRWWQLLMRHSVFMEQSLQERVSLALLDLAYKVGVTEPEKETSSIDLTHQDLAHLVMGSRAKISACLGQLAAQNAIIREGRTRIVLVPEKLRSIAGFNDPGM
jgi:CRP-like cAMP-binding protein